MQINIEDIKVKKRIRHTVGNLEPLKESMKRYGLLNPITINSNNELIAGERRYQAAKQLGWTTINAVVVDTRDKVTQLEMELEENNQRLPFTDEELLEGYAQLEKLKNPGIFRRIINSVKDIFRKVFVIAPEKNSERKLVRARALSFLTILGLFFIIVGAVCAKNNLITDILHTILDLTGLVLLLVGGFHLARWIASARRK